MDERIRRAFDAVRADEELKQKTLDALERRQTRSAPRRRPGSPATPWTRRRLRPPGTPDSLWESTGPTWPSPPWTPPSPRTRPGR